jgi:hypothetical protein
MKFIGNRSTRKVILITLLSFILSGFYQGTVIADELTKPTAPYNATTNLLWNVVPNPSFQKYSQEITITNLDPGIESGNGWLNWIHTTLCWSKGNSLQSSGDSCMWFGLGLLSKRSSGFLASFDLTFMDGKSFKRNSAYENLNCRRESQLSDVAAYTTCSLSIQVKLNKRYRLELLNDESLGSNWWKARFTDVETKESVTIGSIEANFVSRNSELTTAYNHLGYGGKSVACNQVPEFDLLIANPISNENVLSFNRLENGKCITTHLAPSTSADSQNQFLMIGGKNPSLRDQTFRVSRVFFNENVANIQVNLGTSLSEPPDRVLLVSPQLGIEEKNPLAGKISTDTASWSIPFPKALAGASIQVDVYGEISGKKYARTNTSIRLPGVKCPTATDSKPNESQPKVVGFTFTGTNQKFVRVNSDNQRQVLNPSNLVGCYVVPEMINFESPDWQIGSISRDSAGFLFENGAGLKWRLSLIDKGTRLENDPTAPYYSEGRFFILDFGNTSTIEITSTSKSKPDKPTFSGVNFVGNKVNINVNIGTSEANRPDKIYLVAPKLGIDFFSPLAGSISGDKASWSIEFNKLLSGVSLPIEIVGERDGIRSDPLTGTYQIPELLETVKVKSVPDAPKNFTSRIIGTSAVITVEATAKAGAPATYGFLFGNSLGISKSRAIKGDVVGNKVILEVPVKASMNGKKFPVTIYLTNSKGESKPLNATLTIPSSPKVPSLPTGISTTPKVPKTVICVRSNQTRAFEGTQCPPGWEKR